LSSQNGPAYCANHLVKVFIRLNQLLLLSCIYTVQFRSAVRQCVFAMRFAIS
jgi:hypothetical protein